MNIVVIGATSDIAYEVIKKYAENENNLFLVARSIVKLEIIKQDIQARNNNIKIFTFAQDAANLSEHNLLGIEVKKYFDKIDVLFIAYGELSQNIDIFDNNDVLKSLNTNFTSVISYINTFISLFNKQKSGTIAVIGSVAGDRGRQSNFIYGTSKGALEIYLQGLRNKLFENNVNVLLIKPGFVDTKMTSHINKNFLFVSPKFVAEKIINAINKQKDVIYVPAIWWFIMTIIKSIPETIFKKLKL